MPFDPEKFIKGEKSKQGFDPESFLEKRKPKEADSVTGSKIADAALGITQGVAETMNPAAIPHGTEVLGRSVYSRYIKPMFQFDPRAKDEGPRSFAEAVGAAEKESVTPKLNIGEIAAGTRTLARALTSDKKLPELFAEEMQAQEKYEKGLPDTAKKVGEYGAMAISIGSAVKELAKKVPGAAKAADNIANEFATQSLKPMGKSGKKLLSDAPRAREIGKTLRDEGIVTAGASYKDIMTRVDDRLDDIGAKIGKYSKDADALPNPAGVNAQMVAKDIKSRLLPDLIRAGKGDTAKKIENWLDNSLIPAGEAVPNNLIGAEQLQNIKTSLTSQKKLFKAAADNDTADAFESIWQELNGYHENLIQNSLLKQGNDKGLQEFLKLKNKYHDLKSAKPFIDDTVGRMEANRWASLTDYMAGGTGAIGGAAALGLPGAAAAIPIALANRVIRTRGNQLGAGLFGSISQQLKAPTRTIPAAAAAVGSANALLPNEQGR